MLVFYCEYKKQGRVARKITKIGRNPAEQKRCLLQSNNWPLFLREERFSHNQNMIARGYAVEFSVARYTMRVNSPVLAVRRMLSFSALGFEFVFLPSLSELLGGAWPRRIAAHLFYQALATVPLKWTFVNLSI